MGTRESAYFLSSLFYSKRSRISLSWLVSRTFVGNGDFLSQFVMASSSSRILYILFPVSLSFVFGM